MLQCKPSRVHVTKSRFCDVLKTSSTRSLGVRGPFVAAQRAATAVVVDLSGPGCGSSEAAASLQAVAIDLGRSGCVGAAQRLGTVGDDAVMTLVLGCQRRRVRRRWTCGWCAATYMGLARRAGRAALWARIPEQGHRCLVRRERALFAWSPPPSATASPPRAAAGPSDSCPS